MSRFHKILIPSVLIAASVALAQTPMAEDLRLPDSSILSQPDDGDEDAVLTDTVVIVTPDSMANYAGERFKALQLMKVEEGGDKNEAFFSNAMDCYHLTVEALEAQEPGSRNYLRCKEILRDVDTELLKGAFYYSERSQDEVYRFARAYLDLQLLPQFKGDTWVRNPDYFPFIAYLAATNAFNTRDWDSAINYFKLYFSSGATEHRENVYAFMGQACLNKPDYPLAISTMLSGMELYPENAMIPMIGVQACVDGGHAQYLQEFLNKALQLKPQDFQLLTLQGQLYEDENKLKEAIEIFNTLDAIKPNSLTVAKHLGTDYYNLAVIYFSQATNQSDEKAAKRLRRQAKNYFEAAVTHFRSVLDSDPMAVRYMKSLGISYLCLEDKASFERIKERLVALGQDPLEEMFMPPMMSYTDEGGKNFGTSNLSDMLGGEGGFDAPIYAEYAREYVTDALKKWAKRNEFETLDAYNKRVNEQTIRAENDRLRRKAAEEYMAKFGGKLRLNNLSIDKPYDVTNESFEINTNYGPVSIHVPLKDNEAETFRATFAGISFKAPRYFIDETGVRIASVTFVTPGGKSYAYDNQKAVAYNGVPEIDIDFNSILRDHSADKSHNTSTTSSRVRIQKKSDVDEGIPVSSKKANNSLALVIANEDYDNVPPVASAINDGTVFAEYCKLTMGMPAQNVTLVENATLAKLLTAIDNLKNRVEALGGDADVVVYYAGHGMPDERTKDAFILPVDGNATVSRTCYPLSSLYSELGDLNAKSVSVFIDACFSGAQRQQSGDMLTSARAVVIKPKESAPKGNMLVLSAASGNETALPYADKNHGLFTYFLLKRIKETKGNVTLKELSDYVIENVKRESNFINSKPQTPTASTSGSMSELWRTKKIRP